jgi:hypothetical protein
MESVLAFHSGFWLGVLALFRPSINVGRAKVCILREAALFCYCTLTHNPHF